MTPWIVLATMAAYFVILIALSRFAARGADNAAFFGGRRKTPWPLVAVATMGAAISGVTFISVPGMVVHSGYTYLQMALGFVLGAAVVGFVLVPMFYRRKMVSIYGFLEQRFGLAAYRSGAWFFFISKILGASVRFYVVCAVLQVLAFEALGIPFALNVLITIALIWLYTHQGGVQSIIWGDVLKSFCLVMSVVLCIYFIGRDLHLGLGELFTAVANHPTSATFNFHDPMAASYFWKQFVAGAFMTIVMTGLDQDMMQRNLACTDFRASRKNMIVSSIVQVGVISLFLVLGTLLIMYMAKAEVAVPDKSDEIFGLVATGMGLPIIVGILFVVGLIASAYSAAGSALTALTTSFTLDILGHKTDEDEAKLAATRRWVHVAMSAAMGAIIIAFYYLSDSDAISAVYTLAAYTYGPILGLFAFGMFTKRMPVGAMVPLACIAAPFLAWGTSWVLDHAFGYTTGFELLLINGMWTMVGLWISSLLPVSSTNPKQTTLA